MLPVPTQRLKYHLCIRRVLTESMGQYLSLAVDATRVSKKGVYLAALCLPNNVALWLAPQVYPAFLAVIILFCNRAHSVSACVDLGYS